MSENDERVNAQLICFFEKVIKNTAYSYFERQKKIRELEQFDQFSQHFFTENNIKIKQPVTILDVTFLIEDSRLAEIIPLLKEREQLFLIEKIVFDKTDKEIGESFGITRQGITNLKHRLYRKIQKLLI